MRIKFVAKNFCLLKDRMKEIIPSKIQEFKDIKEKYGNKIISDITVSQILGGMRGVNALFYDTSKLDSHEGIMYRHLNLFDICEKLRYKNSVEPLTESLIWYLFTGDIPNDKQVEHLIHEIHRRSDIPEDTERLINSLSRNMHPMTQLSIAMLSIQPYSIFTKERVNTHKSKYWECYFEDSLNIISKLPRIAAIIYNNVFHNGKRTEKLKDSYHMSQNFALMLGMDNKNFHDVISHYIVLHADHEGGNVSAHSVQLAGSSLSDAYYSYSAGLNGLAGPLHGLANQESLKWLLDCQNKLGEKPSDKQLEDYVHNWLNDGKVIPGYGHAVLREVDPRYILMNKLGEKYLAENDLFKLLNQCYRVIPKILQETGKVKNPWPNVDCSSGVILYNYGLKEFDFYTVMFGVSRAIGTLSMLTWAKAYGLPIERPGSVSLDWIKKNVK